MKSYTGALMTLGNGVIQAISTKQKVNSRSSTEYKLISMDDILSKVLGRKLLMEEQECKIVQSVVFRDNTSAMTIEIKGKTSSGKRTRHFEIKYFYVTDRIKGKEVMIEHSSTDSMIADYMMKSLTGTKSNKFREVIMKMN
jgi:hypothetical protein